MGQDREPTNKPTTLWSISIWQRKQAHAVSMQVDNYSVEFLGPENYGYDTALKALGFTNLWEHKRPH